LTFCRYCAIIPPVDTRSASKFTGISSTQGPAIGSRQRGHAISPSIVLAAGQRDNHKIGITPQPGQPALADGVAAWPSAPLHSSADAEKVNRGA